MDDPLYGMHPDPKAKGDYGYNLGAMDARGERGALIVDQDFLMRLPSSFPFAIATDRRARRDATLQRRRRRSCRCSRSPVSTMLPEDEGLQPFAGP